MASRSPPSSSAQHPVSGAHGDSGAGPWTEVAGRPRKRTRAKGEPAGGGGASSDPETITLPRASLVPSMPDVFVTYVHHTVDETQLRRLVEKRLGSVRHVRIFERREREQAAPGGVGGGSDFAPVRRARVLMDVWDRDPEADGVRSALLAGEFVKLWLDDDHFLGLKMLLHRS